MPHFRAKPCTGIPSGLDKEIRLANPALKKQFGELPAVGASADTALQTTPKHLEWFGAFGLMVAVVWMYIEILSLLGELRS